MNLPSQAALARYGAVKVTTASPAQVLLMLYDGLLRFLREGQAAMEAKDRAKVGERIGRAHAILTHLLSTLDFPKNPGLCAQLQALYLFGMRHLLKANIKQDPAMLGELVVIFMPLRDAWSTAAAEVAAAGK